MVRQRWEGDERHDGVADAGQFLEGVAELTAAMSRPGWVAEQPELHLLPHLEKACESLPLRIVEAGTAVDGAYELQLGWTGPSAGVGRIRSSVFSLLGEVAESVSYVRQRRVESEEGVTLAFDVVTGMVDETPFKPHGHTLRLSIAATS